MNSLLRQQIQSACNSVHRNPDDAAAIDRLRRLLNADAGVSQVAWRRMVELACDQLIDDPSDRDTRDRLLLLLAARGSATL
ncbi:hypothetical protein L2K20_19050 [Mycobacterium sp. MBM]|nr:hypothetical protein [Mycobacterium sp. MBM]